MGIYLTIYCCVLANSQRVSNFHSPLHTPRKPVLAVETKKSSCYWMQQTPLIYHYINVTLITWKQAFYIASIHMLFLLFGWSLIVIHCGLARISNGILRVHFTTTIFPLLVCSCIKKTTCLKTDQGFSTMLSGEVARSRSICC